MALPPLSRSAPRVPSRRATLAFAAVLALLGAVYAGYLWFRDSSLVAVHKVTVTGATGPDAPRVRAVLEAAARDMTTMHVRQNELRTAVEPFNSVRTVDVATDFPHGLRIVVRERNPVAAIVAGDQSVAVAGDGTVLRGESTFRLPAIAADSPPTGERETTPAVLRALAVVAAAPRALRAKIGRVYNGPRGLTAPVVNGPDLYFGDAQRLAAKWVAVTRVLSDRSSAGATYIDVRLPERPAAGGLEQPPTGPQLSAVESTPGIDLEATTPAP